MEATEGNDFHHFSHQHPLELIKSPSSGNINCYGCNLRILPGKDYFNCQSCSFSLHRVCSNMPRKTRHPAHPKHYLTLLVSPPSTNTTSKCKACGNFVNGFYYNCAQCDISYHVLCSALPLSVAIPSHPHALKIEFSPPYDFSCDLCDGESDKGWLYRCRFCEFDAHIACAISIQKAQPVPGPGTLTRQIVYSSASIMETNRDIDNGSESNELMQLIVQGAHRVVEEKTGKEIGPATVSGWDERLQSPKENLTNRSGGMGLIGLLQAKPYMPTSSATSPGTQSRGQDPPTPASEDLTIPSYQFSDLCFSIDLVKSYSNYDPANPASKGASFQDSKVIPGAEAKFNYSNTALRNKEVRQLGNPTNKQAVNPAHKGPENWFDSVYLARASTHYNEKFGYEGGPSTGIKTDKSDSASSWYWNLFSCCYSPRYQKCSKSLKNGGL